MVRLDLGLIVSLPPDFTITLLAKPWVPVVKDGNSTGVLAITHFLISGTPTGFQSSDCFQSVFPGWFQILVSL